jgi:hypothetical protein
MHLVDHARAYIEATYKAALARPGFCGGVLARVLPYPHRFPHRLWPRLSSPKPSRA